MKLYKVKDIHNIVYKVTSDILEAQLTVIKVEKEKNFKPLEVFIAVKTI